MIYLRSKRDSDIFIWLSEAASPLAPVQVLVSRERLDCRQDRLQLREENVSVVSTMLCMRLMCKTTP